jgi:glycine dehydrogenase subunit 1
MSLLGKQGLRQVSELCYHKAHYAARQLAQIPGFSLWSQATFFHEFVLDCPQPAAEVNAHLLDHDILGGYDLSQDYPELNHHLLLAFTEMNSKDEIDLLVEALSEVSHD